MNSHLVSSKLLLVDKDHVALFARLEAFVDRFDVVEKVIAPFERFVATLAVEYPLAVNGLCKTSSLYKKSFTHIYLKILSFTCMCCSRVHSLDSDRLHSTQVQRPSWFIEPLPDSIISLALGVRGLPGTQTFFLFPFLADMVLGVLGVVATPPGGLIAVAEIVPEQKMSLINKGVVQLKWRKKNPHQPLS